MLLPTWEPRLRKLAHGLFTAFGAENSSLPFKNFPRLITYMFSATAMEMFANFQRIVWKRIRESLYLGSRLRYPMLHFENILPAGSTLPMPMSSRREALVSLASRTIPWRKMPWIILTGHT
jgi:hypothetical protein